MRIENELLSRFNKMENIEMKECLSQELDFFFDNVMETVIKYFQEEITV